MNIIIWLKDYFGVIFYSMELIQFKQACFKSTSIIIFIDIIFWNRIYDVADYYNETEFSIAVYYYFCFKYLDIYYT